MRRSKGILAIIAIVVLPLALLPPSITRANEDTVTLSIEAPAEVAQASEFSARMAVDYVQDFNSCNFDVTYDPDVITVTAVTGGEIEGHAVGVGPGDWTYMPPGSQDTGRIRVIATVPGVPGPGVTGAGYVAEIRFKVVGGDSDVSDLAISSVAMYDYQATALATTTVDGSVTVAGPLTDLEITTTVLPDAALGQAYSATLAATGGKTSYSWTAIGLPPGLTCSTDGVISGTPTQSGDFSVTVTVTDSAADSQSKVLPLKIYPSPRILTTALPDGQVAMAYEATLEATGGTQPYSWYVVAGELPDGLNLTTATGVVSGTPTAADIFSFTVQVTDDVGATATNDLAISITTILAASPLKELPDVVVPGKAFEVTVTFTSPVDGFNAIRLEDSAPADWAVHVDDTWCTPPASLSSPVTPWTTDLAQYIWFGPYDEGVEFSAVYEVHVPPGAGPDTYVFLGGTLEYYVEGTGPHFAAIMGDLEVEVAETVVEGEIREVNCDILPGVTVTLYQNGTVTTTTVTDGNGNYALVVPEPGEYIVMASRDGLREKQRTVVVTEPAVHTVDFMADHGLIPNAAGMSYVLACINLWQSDESSCKLTMPAVLAVINAWQFPAIQYNLVISSTPGGSVPTPGEGAFTYEAGTVVDLEAEPEEGYSFVNWTGDVDAIADVNAASTTITMQGSYSITAAFDEVTEGLIRNWHDLDAIRDNLTGYYILMNDLDSDTPGYDELASPTANGGQGWEPIGTQSEPFSGTFDGRGHKISSLYIDRVAEYIGLFGSVSSQGVLKDIGMLGSSVTGYRRVGGLVGQNLGTLINCHAAGTVSGDSSVGGLAGRNSGAVNNCHSDAAVTGDSTAGGLIGANLWGLLDSCHASGSVTGGYVGGLVGDDHHGIVDNCYATGSVNGSVAGGLVGASAMSTVSSSYAVGDVTGGVYGGGLVGVNYEGTTVSSCYAMGTVSGDHWVGGLVGQSISLSSVSNSYATGSVIGGYHVGGLVGGVSWSTVSDCYAIGSIVGQLDVGGLVGRNDNGVIGNSFWDTDTSGQATSAGGTGKTTAEMMDIATFTDTATEGLDEPWDIIAVVGSGDRNIGCVWNIVDDETYPLLSWQAV